MKVKHKHYATNILDSNLHAMWYHFSVKNLVGRLRVHDDTCLTMGKLSHWVSQVTLTKWNHRETSQGHFVLWECSNHVGLTQAWRSTQTKCIYSQGLDSEESIKASPSWFRKYFNTQTLPMNYAVPMTSHSCVKHVQHIALQFNTCS